MSTHIPGAISQPTNQTCHWNVLLVEDNIADSLLFSTLFKAKCSGAQVTLVDDGELAVEALFRRGVYQNFPPWDVLLLDLNIPKKTGFEVLAEARADIRLRDLPVFLLTTSASRQDTVRAKALGVASFVTKPSDLDELEATIASLVDVDIPREVAKAKNALLQSDRTAVQIPVGERGEVSADAFRLLVEAVKDYAIFMLDTRGYILTWNEGAVRTKLYKHSEIVGKHFSIFYSTADVQAGHPERELRIAEKEGRYQEEGWRFRKDGSQFWANVIITAIRDDSGKLIGFGKVTRDMTDHKFADEKLRQSEERFRILSDGVVDYAIFMLDPNGYIMSWNRGAERIKGYRASEILGKHFSIFYPEKAKVERHPEYELKVAVEKGSYEEEGIRIRKDGSTFWANVVITALYDESGTLRGFSKVTRDVTERKRVEEEIRALNLDLERRVAQRTLELERSKEELETQKEELVRSNSDLQQFAYVASHDLQEPLRVVVSYLQFLERKVKDKLDPEALQFVDIAVKSAHRMRNLVQDLLSYSQIERGIPPLSAVNLNEVLIEAKKNLTTYIDESAVALSADHLPTVSAEFIQMVQVFQNLIANAITYRHPDRLPQVHIGSEACDGGWKLSFQDNGIGINAKYFEKIFVIFQRLHSNREKFPGTGIGLSICKKITERFRGRIWLESTEGVGSTFFIWLPSPQTETAAPDRLPEADSGALL